MTHSILFSGHMIDGPDRSSDPRFPAANESKVKTAIRDNLESFTQPVRGIASGACGGDILFLETCLELGIPAGMYLPYAPAVFKKGSVSFAGKTWEARFDKLLYSLPVHIIDTVGANENAYFLVNEWMLKEAMVNGPAHMTLMVVWNEIRNAAIGGTSSMVAAAEKQQVKVKIINPS
jgi:hypothetical protein